MANPRPKLETGVAGAAGHKLAPIAEVQAVDERQSPWREPQGAEDGAQKVVGDAGKGGLEVKKDGDGPVLM